MDPVNVSTKSKIRSLPVPELIVIEPPINLEEAEAVRGRGGTVRKSVGDRPSIVTIPLSLRVSEILPLFVLQHATFPTPPLFSPMFPWN